MELLKDQQMGGSITAWANAGCRSAPDQMCKNSGHFPYRRGFIDRQTFAHLAETAVASTYRIYLLRIPRQPIVAA
jgi:hypothetical protein